MLQEWFEEHRLAGIALIAVAVFVVLQGKDLVSGLFGEDTHEFDPQSLVGKTLDEANGFSLVDGIYLQVEVHDYSTLGRNRGPHGRDEELEILAANGPKEVEDDSKITVWVLTVEEAKWYRAHKTTPKIPLDEGGGGITQTNEGESMSPMADLLDVAWDPAAKPVADEDALEVYFPTDQKTWPFKEAKADRKFIDSLVGPPTFAAYSKQWPAVGSPLRMGQPIFVLYRPLTPKEIKAAEAAALEGFPDLDGGIPNLGVPNPDVPGWLCPTRFC